MSPLPEHFAVGGESGTGQCGPFGMRLGMLAGLLGRDAEAEEHLRSTIARSGGNTESDAGEGAEASKVITSILRDSYPVLPLSLPTTSS